MFARVASYEIDLENFGPVAEWFNEHGEALNQQLADYVGSMTLIDRESSTMIGIGLYDSEDNARKVDGSWTRERRRRCPTTCARS
jgi:hypothetical protein